MSAEHGTYAAYQQEKLAGLEPCAACKAANRDYHRQYRARLRPIRCVRGLGWPEASGNSWRSRGRFA